MAEQEGANGADDQAVGEGGILPQVGVIAQYVKDLSFENPNAPAVYQWQGQPQMDVQFNIGTQPVGQDVHEVVLKIDITAKADEGTAFQIELLYAGLFALRNIPERAAAALPARRGAAPALPLRPPDHRRRDGRRRLPAADARPDRLRRPLHAARRAAAGRGSGGQAGDVTGQA